MGVDKLIILCGVILYMDTESNDINFMREATKECPPSEYCQKLIYSNLTLPRVN